MFLVGQASCVSWFRRIDLFTDRRDACPTNAIVSFLDSVEKYSLNLISVLAKKTTR